MWTIQGVIGIMCCEYRGLIHEQGKSDRNGVYVGGLYHIGEIVGE